MDLARLSSAFRSFCTPLASAETQADRLHAAWLEGHGVRQVMLHQGLTITWWQIMPETAPPVGRLLLIHGWRATSASMVPVAQAMPAQGWEVVVFDLPAHGSSSGELCLTTWAVEVAGELGLLLGGFHAIIGQGLGGLLAAQIADGRYPPVRIRNLERLSLFGPAPSLGAMLRGFFQGQPLTHEQRREILASIAQDVQALTGATIGCLDVAAMVSQAGLPTLVLHGAQGRSIAATEVTRYASMPLVTLHSLPGVDGKRRIGSAAAHRMMADFLAPTLD